MPSAPGTAGRAAGLCTSTAGRRTYRTGRRREEAFVRWISFSGPRYWQVTRGSHYLHLQNEHRVTGPQTLQPGKTPARWAEAAPLPRRGSRRTRVHSAGVTRRPHTDRDAGASGRSPGRRLQGLCVSCCSSSRSARVLRAESSFIIRTLIYHTPYTPITTAQMSARAKTSRKGAAGGVGPSVHLPPARLPPSSENCYPGCLNV